MSACKYCGAAITFVGRVPTDYTVFTCDCGRRHQVPVGNHYRTCKRRPVGGRKAAPVAPASGLVFSRDVTEEEARKLEGLIAAALGKEACL